MITIKSKVRFISISRNVPLFNFLVEKHGFSLDHSAFLSLLATLHFDEAIMRMGCPTLFSFFVLSSSRITTLPVVHSQVGSPLYFWYTGHTHAEQGATHNVLAHNVARSV